MYQFSVPDMTCGHCASLITRAVKDADRGAQIDVSLREKRVSVKSSLAEAEIAQALKDAGFTPQQAA